MTEFLEHGLIPMGEMSPRSINEAIEHFTINEFSLGDGSGDYYDATYGPNDWPVRIKSTAWMVSNGPDRAHGRFSLSQEDHDDLIDNHGYYAFVVYERHTDGIIPLFATIRAAEDVERLTDTTHTRIAWPDIFPSTGAEI